MSSRYLYLACAGVIFLLEIAIAKGLLGMGFVRGSVGDILVIMLLYACLRGSIKLTPGRSALLATTFSFSDLLMYCIGGALALAMDHYFLKNTIHRP